MTPEQLGFDSQKLDRARQVLQHHVHTRTTPGAVGLVLRRAGIVTCWAVGHYTYQPNATPVQINTLYDLASVTKVIATTTLCMLFADKDRLNLDAPVQYYVPTFTGKNKNRVTIRHLLAHCSGLPAHVHLYENQRAAHDIDIRDAMFNAACQHPLIYEPGTDTVYSDMGFLTLGKILETIGGHRLDYLAKQHIFEPLKMNDTCYCPPPHLKHRIAPTEDGTDLRDHLVHGEVHDENADGFEDFTQRANSP